jgi:Rrf2 family transcriptional regulator, nitric oxide-sensitive transcriptional repressor
LKTCIVNTYYPATGAGNPAGAGGAHRETGSHCSGTAGEAKMRLTRFTDYALRTLIYLGAHEDRAVPLGEVARAYGVSQHHLVKVAARLGQLGLVTTVRGRRGGLRLAVPAAAVNVGWVVRRTEPVEGLVECLGPGHGRCPITPACGLKHALHSAEAAFHAVLDRYTLAAFLTPACARDDLVALWAGERARVAAG